MRTVVGVSRGDRDGAFGGAEKIRRRRRMLRADGISDFQSSRWRQTGRVQCGSIAGRPVLPLPPPRKPKRNDIVRGRLFDHVYYVYCFPSSFSPVCRDILSGHAFVVLVIDGAVVCRSRKTSNDRYTHAQCGI